MMEKNENGYPVSPTRRGCTGDLINGGTGTGAVGGANNGVCYDCLDDKPLAYSYTPIQRWRMLYPIEKALERATLFEELDKPIEVYGRE